jgi:hypothetical protein
VLGGDAGELDARSDVELGERVSQVTVHRVRGQEQPARHLAVGHPLGDQIDHGLLFTPRLVTDPELSPLDLAVAPGGNLVVSSEWPFGSPGAKATVREYDPSTGQLVRVLAPEPAVDFTRPRGLRFGPGGRLYCVGRDHVVAFEFRTGTFLGVIAELRRLNGQALLLLP